MRRFWKYHFSILRATKSNLHILTVGNSLYRKKILVLNAGNFREWSIITSNNRPSNPQQPIHSLRLAPVRKTSSTNNVLLVKIEGRFGIPSIIIYLLLKGWTKPSINQPTNGERTSMPSTNRGEGTLFIQAAHPARARHGHWNHHNQLLRGRWNLPWVNLCSGTNPTLWGPRSIAFSWCT